MKTTEFISQQLLRGAQRWRFRVRLKVFGKIINNAHGIEIVTND